MSVDAAGKPSFEIHTPSAWDHLAWTPELAASLADVDALYFGTLGQRGATSRATIRRALAVATSSGLMRVLDVEFTPAVLRCRVDPRIGRGGQRAQTQ